MSAKDLDVRNEHLTAEQHDPMVEPMCEITVWCDSATTRLTRFTLMVRHGAKRRRTMGRMRCPQCKAQAWWQAADLLGEDDQDEPAEARPGLLTQLNPFRRDDEEEEAVVADCVVCRAYQARGEDIEVQAVTLILDGNGVCDEHGESMLKILASRLPE